MAMTFARTGRSMKNFEIIAIRPLIRRRGALLGVDLLPWDRAHDASDDDPVVLLQPCFDHAQIADQLPRFDFALLDDIVLVDDKHITAALIAADRRIGHEQRRIWLSGNAHTHEIARQQAAVAIFKRSARGQRSRGRIDSRRDVVELAFVRIALLGLQSDFNRHAEQGRRRLALLCKGRAYLQYVAFAGVEVHPDRVKLHDGGKYGRRARADQFADRDLPCRDYAVERRLHVGVTEIDLGLLFIGLGRLQVGLRRIARRQGLIIGHLGRNLSLKKISLPIEVLLLLQQSSLSARDGRFRGIDFQLVRLGLDREQRGALLDELAVGIADGLNKPLHARDQSNGIDRRRIAGRLEIARYVLLDRRGDDNFGRRRRCVFIVLTAGDETSGQTGSDSNAEYCANEPGGAHGRHLPTCSKEEGKYAINAAARLPLRSDFAPALASRKMRKTHAAIPSMPRKCDRRHDGRRSLPKSKKCLARADPTSFDRARSRRDDSVTSRKYRCTA